MLNSALSFEYSLWWLPVFALVAILYAYLLYKRDLKQVESPLYKYAKFLATFRFLLIFFILVLLLNPFLKTKKIITQKPIIVMMADNSESVKNGFKIKNDTAIFISAFNKLSEKLSSKYDVRLYTLGETLKQESLNSFTAKSTNFSEAFESLNDAFYNQNLGAVILASDGIFNQGINPLYTTENSSYKIFTLALGDTTVPKDARVENVYFNKITYLNDLFSIKADIVVTNFLGANLSVSLIDASNGQRKVISTRNISVNSQRFNQSIDFIAESTKPGVAHYIISIAPLGGEATLANNVKDIYVEVLDGRQKVLLVAASPHPDIAALKSAIENNKNYKLEVSFIDDFSAKFNDYSLVILHQLPAKFNSADGFFTQLASSQKSVFFISGTALQLPNFNKVQNTINIVANPNKFNDVSTFYNQDFSLFTISEPTLESLKKWPPLVTFFGEIKSSPAASTLFYQSINAIKTDYPLLSFMQEEQPKVAVLLGDGIWRWKMYDFLQNKNNDGFNEIINKIVQYLSVVNDKRPFKVNTAKMLFAENEPILFDAQLYNANFEMINSSDVEMILTNEQGQKFDYKFNKSENFYTLNVGFMPSGNYSFVANTSFGGAKFSVNGKFSVSALQLESSQIVANHELLNQLALAKGGFMTTINEIDKITDNLLEDSKLKSLLYDSISIENGINLKWIFALLSILLFLEWALRKWSGGY
jgi:hypothetical protein